jgi:tripartite-type tricarboxylate transporter receptor subunit TctC
VLALAQVLFGKPVSIFPRHALAAVHDPAVAQTLGQLGLDVAGDGPEALASEVRSKVPQWREVIARAGLTVE